MVLVIKMKMLLILHFIVFGGFMRGILMQNVQHSGVLIQGDIMLSPNEDPWDRGPLTDMQNKRWPEGIVPYDLNLKEYSLLNLYTIREAMKEIEKDTCIRFVPRDDHQDYIYITSNGGCWSYLGRQGSCQNLSLVVPQCMNRGTVIHELMHTLGFWHEHSRPDRDDYVQVLWNNIITEEKEANFYKHMNTWQNWTDFHYDYRSVMHYSAFAFSKSPTLPTLVPKEIHVRLKELGRAKTVGTLTPTDKMKVNSFYECPKTL